MADYKETNLIELDEAAMYTAGMKVDSAAKLFYKRTLYNENSKNGDYRNLTDFNFGEKLLYGRVNYFYVPIEAAFGTRATYFAKTQLAASPLKAPSYVVDAFNDLSQQFAKQAQLQKIDTTDPYLSSLLVYKAYEDPRPLYEAYYARYATALNNTFKAEKTKVKNFDEFIKEMYAVIASSARVKPFTYPGFIKSRECPVGVSGLSIEIADLDPNNDLEKIEQFYKSNNWEFFLNACRTYGFMVDKHIPWRIVADIGSSPMIAYAAKYRINSTHEVIRSQYVPAWEFYYRGFKDRLLMLYNKVRPALISTLTECNGITRNVISYPQGYPNVEELSRQISEEEFLRLYFEIRIAEEESQFTDNEKEMMIDDVLEIYMGGGTSRAFAYFERILNKTFDYRGSLSYIINADKKRTNSE